LGRVYSQTDVKYDFTADQTGIDIGLFMKYVNRSFSLHDSVT